MAVAAGVWSACGILPGQATDPVTTTPTTPTSTAASQPADVRLVFLHINDVHGHTQAYQVDGRSTGGYARLATAIQQVRESSKANRVFFLHAGDELSRGDKLTRATLGGANIAIMNVLKLDAFTPGNGDFYDGLDNLDRLMKQARFPFLSANVTAGLKKAPISRPYIIFEAGPVKVAVIGLCFVRTAHPSGWTVGLADPVETARALVPELRKKADIVVALTHIGYEEDVKLAKAVSGIDIIIGAHSHTKLAKGTVVKTPSGGQTIIAQAGDHLRYLGRVDLVLTPATQPARNWRIIHSSAGLIDLDQKIKLDPTVTALIARLATAASQPSTVPAGR